MSALLITAGASVFLLGNSKDASGASNSMGILLLVASLLLDGATGALEDKYMKQYRIGPFAMMHFINRYSVFVALLGVILTQSHWELVGLFVHSPGLILALGGTGALGQMFIFLTISRFGALATSVIGTLRKMLTMIFSIYFFGHVLNLQQFSGMLIAFVGMTINLIRTQPHRPSLGGDEEEMHFIPSENGVKSRQNADGEPIHMFPDTSDALFQDYGEDYAVAVDATFRATTSV
jgi:UDP-galactose transporter B1